MAIEANVYGINANNAVNYTGITVPASRNVIALAFYTTMLAKINQERVRRTATAVTITAPTTIAASDFNALASALRVRGPDPTRAYENSAPGGTGANQDLPTGGGIPLSYGYFVQADFPSVPSASQGALITPTILSTLVTSLIDAGHVCTCNCNYCTCNCNYCTCNCNYACTCNCNYSDERLKENIELVGMQDGINVYQYTYLWDKSKKYQGVMAQELLHTVHAKAVIKVVNGYYAVDYSQLPVEFKEV